MASKEQELLNEYESSAAVSEGSDNDTQDAKEMQMMGKKQQLRRGFEFWSILGFSCCLMTTWAGQFVTFVTGLQNGGPQGLVIAFLATWTAMAAIVASLAELMSMWPTSGGQYHWTYTLAPPRFAPYLSYVCGWQCVLTWQSVVISSPFLTGTWLQGMIVLNYPNSPEIAKPWVGTLIVYAFLALAVVLNTVGSKWLPKMEWFMLFVYIVGFIVLVVTITVLSPQKNSAHEVFQVFFNEGGWDSKGVAWWVGLQGIVYAWLGADGAIHMSEECRNASRTLPNSLMGSVMVNGVLGFASLLAVLFCGGNLLGALDEPTTFPALYIFKNATGSVAGSTGLSSIMLLIFSFSVIGGLAAASREMWAFARDLGLPGSSWLKIVHKRTKAPLYTIAVSILVSLCFNLINLGSAVALNAVISLTCSAFMSTYLLPIGLLLYRRIQAIRGKGKELPWGPWTLGKWSGVAINIYALVWATLLMIFSFFPPHVLPNPTTMNWSSLVFGVVVIAAQVSWFLDGRGRYKGPVRDAAGGAIEPVTGWLEQ